jgi:hypothetical protein
VSKQYSADDVRTDVDAANLDSAIRGRNRGKQMRAMPCDQIGQRIVPDRAFCQRLPRTWKYHKQITLFNECANRWGRMGMRVEDLNPQPCHRRGRAKLSS